MFLAYFPEEGISDYIAHGSIIQVFTIAVYAYGYDMQLCVARKRGKRNLLVYSLVLEYEY